MNTSKICRDCATVKPLTDFPVASAEKDGRNRRCFPCWNAYQRHQARIRRLSYRTDSDVALELATEFINSTLVATDDSCAPVRARAVFLAYKAYADSLDLSRAERVGGQTIHRLMDTAGHKRFWTPTGWAFRGVALAV